MKQIKECTNDLRSDMSDILKNFENTILQMQTQFNKDFLSIENEIHELTEETINIVENSISDSEYDILHVIRPFNIKNVYTTYTNN